LVTRLHKRSLLYDKAAKRQSHLCFLPIYYSERDIPDRVSLVN
jgi:hypothetical protein